MNQTEHLVSLITNNLKPLTLFVSFYLKIKPIYRKIILASLGATYLNIFSHLEINLFFKGYAVLIPVQIIALIYALNLIREQKTRLPKR